MLIKYISATQEDIIEDKSDLNYYQFVTKLNPLNISKYLFSLFGNDIGNHIIKFINEPIKIYKVVMVKREPSNTLPHSEFKLNGEVLGIYSDRADALTHAKTFAHNDIFGDDNLDEYQPDAKKNTCVLMDKFNFIKLAVVLGNKGVIGRDKSYRPDIMGHLRLWSYISISVCCAVEYIELEKMVYR